LRNAMMDTKSTDDVRKILAEKDKYLK